MVEPLWVIKLLSFSGTLRELKKPITPSRRPISKKISVIGDFVGCDYYFEFMFPFSCTFFLVSSVFFIFSVAYNTCTNYLSNLLRFQPSRIHWCETFLPSNEVLIIGALCVHSCVLHNIQTPSRRLERLVLNFAWWHCPFLSRVSTSI